MTVNQNYLGAARTADVYDSAARTAAPAVQEYEQLNDNMSGLALVIDMTAVTATGTVTFSVLGLDRTSGKTWTLISSTALAAVATTVLRVHPNLPASANLTAQDLLPPVIRVQAVHNNGVAMTYSVAAHFGA